MADMKKISIQGQPASYHDTAQEQFFGDGNELICRDNFRSVFTDVKNGEVDYGVVAIENSLYGSINEVYDQLLNNHEWISGEVYLRIHHALIGLPDAKLEDIKEVYSQREAIAQCTVWLDTHLPNATIHETNDTAGSVRQVAEWGDRTKVAIAGEKAAEHYGLSVLERGIETNKQNYTRFIILTRDKTEDSEANKTSIILTTSHTSGALYEALGFFAENNLNLSKLESRPIPGTIWKYMFYLDFEASLSDKRTEKVIASLLERGNSVRILGSYKAGEMPKENK